ncbi:MAG: hypothetical protein P8H98_12800, partial [Flavobacteriales bacterium]|nr:hypothetical protein [Flavobacteriales bacterium]
MMAFLMKMGPNLNHSSHVSQSTFVNRCSTFFLIAEQGTPLNDLRSGLGAEIKNLLKSTFVNRCSIFLFDLRTSNAD